MRNFELLRQVKMPMEQEDICKFLCGNPIMQGTTTQSIDSVLTIYPVAVSETMVPKIPPKKDITKLEVLYTFTCIVLFTQLSGSPT